jgi:hypothetical protein
LGLSLAAFFKKIKLKKSKRKVQQRSALKNGQVKISGLKWADGIIDLDYII